MKAIYNQSLAFYLKKEKKNALGICLSQPKANNLTGSNKQIGFN